MRRPPIAGLLIAFLLLGSAAESSPQSIFELARRNGELGFDFLGASGAFGERSRSTNARFREWVKLPFTGALIHPSVFSYSLVLRPTLTQGVSNLFRETVDSRRLDIDFSSRVLTAKPLSLTFAVSRAAGSSGGRFGSFSDFKTSSMNGSLSVRFAPFPMRLTYTGRATERTWQTSPQVVPVGRAERVQTIGFWGQSSKTIASLQRTSFDDRVGVQDFTSWLGRFGHVFRWGKGSSIASSIDFIDRSARSGSPFSQFSWTERVRLQHTRKIGSDLRYRLFNSRVNRTESRNRFFGVGVDNRLSSRLGVGMSGSVLSNRFGERSTTVYTLAPRLNFSASLPWGLRLVGGGAFGYEWRQRQLGDGEPGLVPVINERHVVEPTLRFFLDNPDADHESIIVRSADQLTVYELDVDYELLTVASSTEVLIRRVSEIQPGDALLISYRFRLSEGRRDKSLTANYNVLLARGAFRLRHHQSFRDTQSMSEGAPLRLADFNDVVTTLSAERYTPAGMLRIDGERRHRASDTFRNTVYRVRAALSLPTRPGLQSALGGNWSVSVTDERSVNVIALNSTVTWTAAAGLRVHGRLEAFSIHQDAAGSERFLGGLLEANWRFALIEMTLRYEHQRRDVGIQGTVNRLSVRAVRRF